MKTENLLIIGILLVIGKYNSQTNNLLNPNTKTCIDSTYKARIKKNKIVGASIAIIDNGKIVYATGYGFSDLKNKVEANENTIYRIGSCTKAFTCLSIMQLQEKGLLNIIQSIKNYLPDLTIKSRFNDTNEIYINEVMAHISGLPSDIYNGFFCDAPPNGKWLIQQLNNYTTAAPRQYKHAYSNVGYGLLGEVISRLSGQSYSNYVKEKIFAPLEMTSSFIEMDNNLKPRFSKAYFGKKEVYEPLIRDQAAGLIHSSAIDVCKFLNCLINEGRSNDKQLISSTSYQEMSKNQLSKSLFSKNKNWGFGLYTSKAQLIDLEKKDTTVISIPQHGGDTYAYHSDFAYIPALGIGAVVLTNTDSGTEIADATSLLSLYLKKEKGKKINSKYKPKRITNNEGVACSDDEIKGSYVINGSLIEVKNLDKIKFKQGPAKVCFIKNDSNTYTVKAKLFGFIPIKIKDQAATFAKLNDRVYLKFVQPSIKQTDFMAAKELTKEIPDTWKKQFGNYKIKQGFYTCNECVLGDPKNMSIKLNTKNGLLQLKSKGTGFGNDNFYASILNNQDAVTAGMGRATGDIIKILPNGNLYFQGFEFEKVK